MTPAMLATANGCTRRRWSAPGAGPTNGRSNVTNFTCIIEGCPSLRPGAHGLCNTHYARKRRTGTVADPMPREKVVVTCGAEGCERVACKVGFCAYHYTKQRKAGQTCAEDGCERPVMDAGLCKSHYTKKLRAGSCHVEGCTNKRRHRGLCEPHYRSRLRNGTLPPLDCQYCGSTDGVKALVCAKCSADRRRARIAERAAVAKEQRKAIRAAGVPCAACGTPIQSASRKGARCVPCSRYIGAGGYVYVYIGGRRSMTEHRYIMERHLGRPLSPSENVHHINGIRTDNRLANLEIWIKSQPCGQRASDHLAWARRIVALYGDDFDQGRLL